MADEVKKELRFARMVDGQIEIVDIFSGRVVRCQTSIHDILDETDPELLEYNDSQGNKVLVEKSISLDKVKDLNRYAIPFSNVIADIICDRVANGESLTKICNEDSMPTYRQLCVWRRENQEFAEALRDAKLDSGEVLFDKAMEIAEGDDIPKADVPGLKLKAELYKWAAGVRTPEDFGNRTKIVGDVNAPIQFIIDTGVPQPKDIDVTPKDEQCDSKNGKPELKSLNGTKDGLKQLAESTQNSPAILNLEKSKSKQPSIITAKESTKPKP